MSKALIIKDANFSNNKVATITFETVLCTSIELSDEVIRESKQLEYVVTPLDCTEKVVFTASNQSVATVSASGYVTIVGKGTANIIATCGSKQAICTVINEDIIDNTEIYNSVGYGFNQTMNRLDSKNSVDLKKSASQNTAVFYEKNGVGGCTWVGSDEKTFISENGVDAIFIPSGKTSVVVEVPSGHTVIYYFCNSTDKTLVSNTDRYWFNSFEKVYGNPVDGVFSRPIPSGSDCLYIAVRNDGGTSIDTENINVSFI